MTERTDVHGSDARRTMPSPLVGIARVVLGHPRLFLTLPLATAALVLALHFVMGTTYVARSTFVPEVGEGSASRFAGVAAQFGIALDAGGAAGETLQFYTKLIESEHILRALATTQVEGPEGDSAPLYRIIGAEGDSEREVLLDATERLRGQIEVASDVEAGVITLHTRAATPDLAAVVNRRILDLLDAFNLERRQSQARSEREFVAERMEAATAEMAEAERELEEFLERNRTYQTSPQLVFEAERLQNRLQMRRQIYAALAQSYEQARIDEVRNTAVLTIVDDPEGSSRRAGGLVTRVAMALVFGLMLALALAVLLEYVAWKRRTSPEEYAELKRLAREARARLRPAGRSRTSTG